MFTKSVCSAPPWRGLRRQKVSKKVTSWNNVFYEKWQKHVVVCDEVNEEDAVHQVDKVDEVHQVHQVHPQDPVHQNTS